MRYLSHKEEIWFFRQVNFMKDEWVVKIYWNSRWSDAVLGWRHVGGRLCIGERAGKNWGEMNQRTVKTNPCCNHMAQHITMWHRRCTISGVWNTRTAAGSWQMYSKLQWQVKNSAKMKLIWGWKDESNVSSDYKVYGLTLLFFCIFLEKNKRSQLSFPCWWQKNKFPNSPFSLSWWKSEDSSQVHHLLT